MEITNLPFDFGLLGENAPDRAKKLRGNTVTFYPSQIGISPDLLDELENPKRVEISFSEILNAFVLFASDEGRYEIQYDKGCYFNAAEVTADAAKILGYDRKKEYCRLMNGEIRSRNACLFRKEDAAILQRQCREVR